jgi:hypothetical protein
MIASGDAGDSEANNYTDYCFPVETQDDDVLPDKSELPLGDEHPDHCLADFMKTSQSAYWNRYGWSYFSPVGPAMTS